MTAISCVLPVFNGATYLEEAIQSVLRQTFSDFELVIIDDGSTDLTPEIIAEAATRDRRVVSLRQDNAGIVAALNAGLRVAKGRYIARMDADDICLPNRFAFQAAYLDEHPACVLVGGLAQAFSSSEPLGTHSGGRHRQTDLKCFPPKVAVSIHPLIMIRRATMERLGGYRNLFPHAEDYDLYLRLVPFGSIDNPNEVILQYRRHSEAVSLRHLGAQERNAVLAEACAIKEDESKQAVAADANVEAIASEIWPPWLLEPYVSFRIWRRVSDLSQQQRAALPKIDIVSLVLNLSPKTLFSSRYFALRARIVALLLRPLF